jgi:Mrp family chromosome partitioning ATPase
MPIRHGAKRLRNNLWLLPPNEGGEDGVSMSSTQAQLSDLRREFEYSIVEARPAGESDEAMAMAQFADGIILVLSARHTRRATALKIKEALVAAEANLLGTVLSDREFPIPERIYRRL